MHAILDAFWTMSPAEAAGWIVVQNVGLFVLAIGLGHLLVVAYRGRGIGAPPEPLEWAEVGWAGLCVVMNSAVTVVGWWLWRGGWIVIRRDTGARAWLDVVVLLFAMDLAMYVSHRIAHIPWIYRVVHATHHRYDRPRPIDLFVLNPLEVLGFGGLWLGVLLVYSSSWLGIVVYLTLNLLFGMAGHLGVEPLPAAWARNRLLGQVGTSTFHAGHHRDPVGNFGFYSLVWDRLFGTLHKGYTEDFGRSWGASADRGRGEESSADDADGRR